MGKVSLWDAVAPMPNKPPKVVREYEILRVSGTIPGADSAMAAQKARNEILKWVERRSGSQLPKEAWEYEGFDYFAGGRNTLCVRINNETTDIWAIRAEDPDKEVAGRIWITEIVIGNIKGQPPLLSTRSLFNTSEFEPEVNPHVPGFLQQIAESTGLWAGSYELTPAPRWINSDDEAKELVTMLLNTKRRLPVFVISYSDASQDVQLSFADAKKLAQATLGIAHVVMLPNHFSRFLTESFGKTRSVSGGSVRAYLPGFVADANPHDHRLFLKDSLISIDGAVQCLRWMCSLAATESIRNRKLGREVLAFSNIRSEFLRERQAELQEQGADDSEQLLAAKEHIKALEFQLTQEKAAVQDFSTEHEAAELRAQVAEDQLRGASYRIQMLTEQLKLAGQQIGRNDNLPNTWDDIANWCDTALAGLLSLTPNARRGLRSPEFEDVEATVKCLVWLATECRDRRMNGGDGSLREEEVVKGIRNAHCGQDQFDLNWQGRRYTSDWHIKNGGNTRDPKRCLRIYYFWDPDSQQIVVTEMPAHRRTGAS